MDDDLGPTDLSPAEPGLTPEEELELGALRLKAAGIDEEETAFPDDVAPKVPHPREEAVTDRDGMREVDIQTDTVTVDDGVLFDFDAEDLRAVDLF
jgi:hypothetical protein